MKKLRGMRMVAIFATLTLIPFAANSTDNIFSQAKAASDNAGGKGKGGENGGGQGNGKNGGGGGSGGSNEASLSNNGNSKNKTDLGIRPNELGRLNAFLNASSKALKNSAPNSAIGIISVQYAGALSAYIEASNTLPAPPVPPSLADAAALLAKAANKPLTAEIVAAINQRLAAENPDNVNLAGLADPVNEVANNQLAEDLTLQANTLQESEANQGLGPIY
jgi:hypothetical protein